MTNISRNIEKREELQRQIEVIEAKCESAIVELDAELDASNISYEEWERRFEEIRRMFDTSALIFKKTALEYKECRNDWFRSFVQSFGECVDRKVSSKQANIFYRYTEQSHINDWGYVNKRYVRVGNLFVEFERTKNNNWVTITRFE